MFGYLYDRVMRWARHPKAPIYLACMSFSEASFFPIPPDTMLMPMALSQPHRAIWYATLATVFSMLGGLFGYVLGAYFIHLVLPVLHKFGYYHAYLGVQQHFLKYGFWILLIAGFTPIPYKLFTIAGGAMHMMLLPFIVASVIGRAGRFYLVALLMAWGGERLEETLRRYINWIVWSVFVLALIIYLVLHV